MISRSLLYASTLGLAAGVLAGMAVPKGGGGAQRRFPAALHADAATSPAPDAGQRLAFPGDDARIARVFSALQQPVRLRQRFELFEALRDLDARDYPALVKRAELLPKKTGRDLLRALLARWFELDPGAAGDWALNHLPLENETQKAWVQSNPEAAFQFALRAGKGAGYWLFPDALNALYGADSAAKMARARTLPPGELRTFVISEMLADWAKRDPAAAFAALGELPPGRSREDAQNKMLLAWADQDAAGALAKVSELVPTLNAGVTGNMLLVVMAERVAAKDPRLAFEWLAGLPDEFRSAPAIAAAKKWAQSEPIAALDWCMANGVDVARVKPMGASAWQWGVLSDAFEHAPSETMAWLEALPRGAERDRLMESVLRTSVLGPGEQHLEDDSSMAWRIFRQLPEDAQAVHAAAFGRKRAEQGGLSDLGAWAQNFAPGPVRANAVAGAMNAAYARDTSQVEALLAQTAPGADRDAALRGLSGGMAHTAPADAAVRALQIGEPTVRRQALELIALQWLETEEKAGREWLQNAAVPAEWKQDWLRQHEAEEALKARM